MANVFTDLFTNDPQKAAAAKGTADVQQGLTAATNQLTAGKTAASQYLDTASSQYDPLKPGAKSAWDQYVALTTGDPTTVTNTLENQPGFQAALKIANQGVNRTMAAGGMGNSGNAMIAASDRARELELGNINSYAQRLLALAGYAPQFAGAQAGIYGQQAANEMTTGLNLGNLTTSAWNTIAGYDTAAENARAQAAKNVFDAVMGGAGLATKIGTSGVIPGLPINYQMAGGGGTPWPSGSIGNSIQT